MFAGFGGVFCFVFMRGPVGASRRHQYRRWRAQCVADNGVMVGRLRTALGKTAFPETSASHRAIPRDLVQLVEMLSGGRSPLTIGVISSGSLDGESLLGSRI